MVLGRKKEKDAEWMPKVGAPVVYRDRAKRNFIALVTQVRYNKTLDLIYVVPIVNKRTVSISQSWTGRAWAVKRAVKKREVDVWFAA